LSAWNIFVPLLVPIALGSLMLAYGLMLLRRALAEGKRRSESPMRRQALPSSAWLRNPETVSLIYEHTKDAPQQQLDLAKALDDKMVKIFTAAGVVIGLAGFSDKSPRPEVAVNVLLLSALATFVLTAVLTVYHLWPLRLDLSKHASVLWEHSRRLPVDQVRQQLVRSIARGSSYNKGVLIPFRSIDVIEPPPPPPSPTRSSRSAA
jgi:hypothetical protein